MGNVYEFNKVESSEFNHGDLLLASLAVLCLKNNVILLYRGTDDDETRKNSKNNSKMRER